MWARVRRVHGRFEAHGSLFPLLQVYWYLTLLPFTCGLMWRGRWVLNTAGVPYNANR